MSSSLRTLSQQKEEPDVDALSSTLQRGSVLDDDNRMSPTSDQENEIQVQVPNQESDSGSESEERSEALRHESHGLIEFKLGSGEEAQSDVEMDTDGAATTPAQDGADGGGGVKEPAKPVAKKRDDLPKMADFLPDIRARIDMLKRPSKPPKGKKEDKKKEQEQAEGAEEGATAHDHSRDIEYYGEHVKGHHNHQMRAKKVMFGIGKKGVERAVIRFREKPGMLPLHLGFDFPNSSLSHKQVYKGIMNQLAGVEGSKIITLKFQERNVMLGARGGENRWIFEMNCLESRDELLQSGIAIFNRKVKIRRYDEMLEEDYSDFLKLQKLQKGMKDLSARP